MDAMTPPVADTPVGDAIRELFGGRYAELGLPTPQVTWRFREDFFPEALAALGAATPDPRAARRAACWCATHARLSIVDLVFDHDAHGPPLDQSIRPEGSLHPVDADDMTGTLWAFTWSDPHLPVGSSWRPWLLMPSGRGIHPWGWRWSQPPNQRVLFDRLSTHADAWVCTPERVVLAAGWRTEDLSTLRPVIRPGAGSWPSHRSPDGSPVRESVHWAGRFVPDTELPNVWHSAEELVVPGLRMAVRAFIGLGVGPVEWRTPFADGGIMTRRTGGAWRSTVVGSVALRFVCQVLGLEQPTQLPGEVFTPDPDSLASLVLRSAHGPHDWTRLVNGIQPPRPPVV